MNYARFSIAHLAAVAAGYILGTGGYALLWGLDFGALWLWPIAIVAGVIWPFPGLLLISIPFSMTGYHVLQHFPRSAPAIAVVCGAMAGAASITLVFYGMEVYAYHFRPEINPRVPALARFGDLTAIGLPAGAVAGWVFWRVAVRSTQL
jgi:hypothetical protein